MVQILINNWLSLKLNLIQAKKNKIFESVFSLYLNRLLKKHFFKIHISGEENLKELNKSAPTIIYANHSNWWDGFMAFYLADSRWKIDSYLMMDVDQMRKYRFFKWLGVFSVDRTSPQSSMESLNYAESMLTNSSRTLWLFPQGVLLPNDLRPLKFFSGITALTEKLGTVNLVPLAMKYEFMTEQRPEVFLKIGKADIVKQFTSDKKDYTLYLQNKLTTELDGLKSKIISGDMMDFSTIFYGRDSRNKTFDKINP